MTVKDFLSKILDSYQEIVINKYKGKDRTGNKWTIKPHCLVYYRHIPEEILNSKIRFIVPYYSYISVEVEV